jgi:hypothetical protein
MWGTTYKQVKVQVRSSYPRHLSYLEASGLLNAPTAGLTHGEGTHVLYQLGSLDTGATR